ncbi:cysteine hydrolase [Stenotrophomonas sp. ISL-67]|uniref:cysteine hydrolase family protein n=1 Tax=Stenotrophomonas sp. ISL-67 TaxID=2819171 RepID=UPI001BE6D9AD|nr:isochorismatase family cysteine hydrolase [Stenotrophomonas sp. ISL-67]MBT2767077.1 cysteine hydrolase [Stenotrophomonas sp. ISL-67]
MKKHNPALLIIDMFTRFDFPEAKDVEPGAMRAARQIARLVRHFRTRGLPVIYANDNFANWQMDFKELVQVCLATEGASSTIAKVLRPQAGDYFILKPKHSAFLATPLAVLLAKLGVSELVVTGMTAESCVAATCFDSNAREYDTVVVREAVAGIADRKASALRLLQNSKAAEVIQLSSYLRR